MPSVLQDWVAELPLREQATLLTAVRGCDVEPKEVLTSSASPSQARRLVAWVRWCFMVPDQPREVENNNSFMSRFEPIPFFPEMFGHLPQHWYAHIMHALEIIGYRHPDVPTRTTATELYRDMVRNLHLNHETAYQMEKRLQHRD